MIKASMSWITQQVNRKFVAGVKRAKEIVNDKALAVTSRVRNSAITGHVPMSGLRFGGEPGAC